MSTILIFQVQAAPGLEKCPYFRVSLWRGVFILGCPYLYEYFE